MAGLVPPGATPDASKPAHSKADEKTDYMNLPCPIPYEELHREALSYSSLLTSFSIWVFLFILFFIDFLTIS